MGADQEIVDGESMAGGEGQRPSGASGDLRLTLAHGLLERESFRVLSLDVFDTLLWRVVPEPTDAFVLLGNHLHRRGMLSPQVSPHLFGRLRERAEQKARQRVGAPDRSPEISLEAIYEELPEHLFEGSTGQVIAEEEVGFERSITFPDLDVLELAKVAQDKFGARIVLVSDTYFSPRQLKTIVDRERLADLSIETSFTSSQYGVGKGSGLYKVVLDALGVVPEEMLHVGDNLEADVECAQEAGIRAVHFDKLPGTFRTVLEREGLYRTHHRQRVKPTLDPRGGDFGLTAVRSKTLNRTKHDHAGAAENPYWRFGASVLGPVFTAFAEWVHQRARDEGVSTVFCAMREGEFLSRLVNAAQSYVDSPVQARPIWLSRQVCSRAALGEATVGELSDFMIRRVPPTLKDLCESVGVALDEVPGLHLDGATRLDDTPLAQRVLEVLAEQPEVRGAILSRASALRTRLADYFVKTVGAVDGPVMLVDIGWGGTIQSKLDRSLALAGVGTETIGLYLLTNHVVLDRMLSGLQAEGFLASGGIPQEIDWITRSPEVLEQVCMSDTGSLVDITADGDPVLGPVPPSSTQTRQRVAVQAGILAFQQEWARYSSLVPAESRTLDGAARPQLIKMMSRFTTSPTTEEAALFADWMHDDNYGSAETETMVPRAVGPRLRYMTPSQLLDLPMTKVYWPFGLTSLYNGALALSAGAIAEGVLPADAFASTQPCEVRVSVDSGAGFCQVVTASAGPNNNGLSYLRAEVGGRPIIREISLRCSDGPGILRIDWLHMVLHSRDQADPLIFTMETPQELGELRFQNAVPLASNLVLGPTQSPEVIYRCPGRWASSVHRAELELGFAWMPLEAGQKWPTTRSDVLVHLVNRLSRRARNLWLNTAQQANAKFRPPS